MPYTIDWLYPNRVLIIKMIGSADIEDAAKLNEILLGHLEQATVHLHMLLDFTEMTSFPLNVHKARGTQEYMKHPKFGWLIAYGSRNPVVKMLAAIVTQISNIRWRLFDTHAEAIAFLEEYVLSGTATEDAKAD
jgi:hypothetical protein